MADQEFIIVQEWLPDGREIDSHVYVDCLLTVDMENVVSIHCDCKGFFEYSLDVLYEFLVKLLSQKHRLKMLKLENCNYFMASLLPYLKNSSIEMLSVNKKTITSNFELQSLMDNLPAYVRVLTVVENSVINDDSDNGSSNDNDSEHNSDSDNDSDSEYKQDTIQYCWQHSRYDDCAVLTSRGIYRATESLINNITVTGFNNDFISMDGVTSGLPMFKELFLGDVGHSRHGVGTYIMSRNKCIQKIIKDTIITTILIFRNSKITKDNNVLRMINRDITRKIAKWLYESRNDPIWKNVMPAGTK